MQITYLFTLVALLFLTGCSQKISVQAIEPAEIDRISSTKKISVAPFKNDKVGLATKIEANLSNHRLDNKKYFTIVSRNDFNKIIQEQKIQNSGLMNESTAVDVGNLIGAQAIISGNVNRVTSNDNIFYEKRLRCLDKKCKKYTYDDVRCKKRVVGVSAEVRIVNVLHGEIIHAETLNKTQTYKHCLDDNNVIPTKEIAAQKMALMLANSFTYKLLPHYKNFQVTLLDDPDLDYSDKQEKLLETSLKYIELKRYDKAEQFLFELIDSTQQQSYVAFYNLGVIKEVQGNYREAKEYYGEADKLMLEPVDEISNAYLRINNHIEKRERAFSQINRESK